MIVNAEKQTIKALLTRFKLRDLLDRGSRLRFKVRADDRVIVAAINMASLNLDVVPVICEKEGDMPRVFTGFNILNLLYTHQGGAWNVLSKVECFEVAWPPILSDIDNSLLHTLKMMHSRRRGFVIPIMYGKPLNITISTLEVAQLLASLEGRYPIKGIALSDVATKGVITVSKESSIQELIHTMVANKIRRVLVREENKIIRDNDIIRYLLARGAVKEFTKDSYKMLNEPVNSLSNFMKKPAITSPFSGYHEALNNMLKSEAKTVISHDGRYIATSWDLTVGLLSKLKIDN